MDYSDNLGVEDSGAVNQAASRRHAQVGGLPPRSTCHI